MIVVVGVDVDIIRGRERAELGSMCTVLGLPHGTSRLKCFRGIRAELAADRDVVLYKAKQSAYSVIPGVHGNFPDLDTVS